MPIVAAASDAGTIVTTAIAGFGDTVAPIAGVALGIAVLILGIRRGMTLFRGLAK